MPPRKRPVMKIPLVGTSNNDAVSVKEVERPASALPSQKRKEAKAASLQAKLEAVDLHQESASGDALHKKLSEEALLGCIKHETTSKLYFDLHLKVGTINKRPTHEPTIVQLMDSLKLNKKDHFFPAIGFVDPDDLTPDSLAAIRGVPNILDVPAGTKLEVLRFAWQTPEYLKAMTEATFGITFDSDSEEGRLLSEQERNTRREKCQSLAANKPRIVLGQGQHRLKASYRLGENMVNEARELFAAGDHEGFNRLAQKAKALGAFWIMLFDKRSLAQDTIIWLATNATNITHHPSRSETAYMMSSMFKQIEHKLYQEHDDIPPDSQEFFTRAVENVLEVAGDTQPILQQLIKHRNLQPLMPGVSGFDPILDSFMKDEFVNTMATHEAGGIMAALVYRSVGLLRTISHIKQKYLTPGEPFNHWFNRFQTMDAKVHPSIGSQEATLLCKELFDDNLEGVISTSTSHMYSNAFWAVHEASMKEHRPSVIKGQGLTGFKKYFFHGADIQDIRNTRRYYLSLSEKILESPQKGRRKTSVYQTKAAEFVTQPELAADLPHHVKVLGAMFKCFSNSTIDMLQPELILPGSTFFKTISAYFSSSVKSKQNDKVFPTSGLTIYAFGYSQTYIQDIQSLSHAHSTKSPVHYDMFELRSTHRGFALVIGDHPPWSKPHLSAVKTFCDQFLSPGTLKLLEDIQPIVLPYTVNGPWMEAKKKAYQASTHLLPNDLSWTSFPFAKSIPQEEVQEIVLKIKSDAKIVPILADLLENWRENLTKHCDWDYLRKSSSRTVVSNHARHLFLCLSTSALVKSYLTELKNCIQKHPILLDMMRISAIHQRGLDTVHTDRRLWFVSRRFLTPEILQSAWERPLPWKGDSTTAGPQDAPGTTEEGTPGQGSSRNNTSQTQKKANVISDPHNKASSKRKQTQQDTTVTSPESDRTPSEQGSQHNIPKKKFRSASVIPSELDHSDQEEIETHTVPSRSSSPQGLPVAQGDETQAAVPQIKITVLDKDDTLKRRVKPAPNWCNTLPHYFLRSHGYPEVRGLVSQELYTIVFQRIKVVDRIHQYHEDYDCEEEVRNCNALTQKAILLLKELQNKHHKLQADIKQAIRRAADSATQLAKFLRNSDMGVTYMMAGGGALSATIKSAAISELAQVISKYDDISPMCAEMEAIRILREEPEFANKDVFSLVLDPDNDSLTLQAATWVCLPDDHSTQKMADQRNVHDAELTAQRFRPVISSGSTEVEANARALSMVSKSISTSVEPLAVKQHRPNPHNAARPGCDILGFTQATQTILVNDISHLQAPKVILKRWVNAGPIHSRDPLWFFSSDWPNVLRVFPQHDGAVDENGHEMIKLMIDISPCACSAYHVTFNHPDDGGAVLTEDQEKSRSPTPGPDALPTLKAEDLDADEETESRTATECYSSDDEKDRYGNLKDFIEQDDEEPEFVRRGLFAQVPNPPSPYHRFNASRTPSVEPEENDVDFEAMERKRRKRRRNIAVAKYIDDMAGVDTGGSSESEDLDLPPQPNQALTAYPQSTTPEGPSRASSSLSRKRSAPTADRGDEAQTAKKAKTTKRDEDSSTEEDMDVVPQSQGTVIPSTSQASSSDSDEDN